MTAPVPLALRELMILTKCYCDGEHPRLGHNCSFRRDVETVVAAVQSVLAMCNEAIPENDPRFPADTADNIRRALLGLPPWRDEDPALAAQVAERLQRAEADRRLSEGGGGPSGPG